MYGDRHRIGTATAAARGEGDRQEGIQSPVAGERRDRRDDIQSPVGGKKRSPLLRAMALLLASLLIVACQSDSPDSEDASRPGPPPPAARSTPPPGGTPEPSGTAAGEVEKPKPKQEPEQQLEKVSQKAATKEPLAPATPEEIARYQQELARSVAAERADAQRGDLLTPGLTRHLMYRFQQVIESPNGAAMLLAIQEANPGKLPLAVNGEYPVDAAVTTMPPALLQAFPSLPPGIEYRFVECQLILLARESRLILDYTEECFW